MKKFLKLTLSSIFLILLVSSQIEFVKAENFPDISRYHTYANEIEYIKDHGFVSGFSDGTYRPEQPITRAEFTKIVINAKYEEDFTASCLHQNYIAEEETFRITYDYIFPDIAGGTVSCTDNTAGLQEREECQNWDYDGHPFSTYICVAKEEDIIKGFTDGTFKPENNITYGEALKIAMRTLDENHNIDKNAELMEYLNRMDLFNARPPTITEANVKHITNRGEVAHIIQIIHNSYTPLDPEPEKPKAVYNFMMKRNDSHTILEEGISMTSHNFGIHCTTSEKMKFIELNVAKDGQSQRIHLQVDCSNNSTQEADAFGFHFKLTDVIERVAWDIDSFEYYIEMREN
ncbi:hypothetical protein GF362_02400 [Candidatus Dojkabacteria bacterium]|nr:hypothetical protein [Candidatus Dojkabacteria bacterium]